MIDIDGSDTAATLHLSMNHAIAMASAGLSFAENDNKSDESNTNDQSDLDFAQELPENVEQSTALQGDGLVNVIA